MSVRISPVLSATIWSVLICFGVPLESRAAAVRGDGLFASVLGATDDGSVSAELGFTIEVFGLVTSEIYINNNGNVSFGTALSSFTSAGLPNVGQPILAPYFSDVDTRGVGGGEVIYGQATIAGKQVFGVTWSNVGFFNRKTDKLNRFQVILTDRSDIAVGDFDFEFNYDQIQWETGDFSGGFDGLGGSPAVVGWTNGTGGSYEFPGSRISGSFLDGGTQPLIDGMANSSVAGRYAFEMRGGQVIPEPQGLALVALGGLVLLALRIRASR